jgi:hypothetical protein
MLLQLVSQHCTLPLSVGDKNRGQDESNSLKPQKSIFKAYAQQNTFLPIKHYTDDGKSGRFLGACLSCNDTGLLFWGTFSMNDTLSKCQKKDAQVTKTRV